MKARFARRAFAPLSFAVIAAIPAQALAQAAQTPTLNTGNTAWVLTATALVLFMTLPGLALFYGGLVRAQSVLSVLMQCSGIACLVSVLWLAFVYSLAFGDGSPVVGYLGKAFLLSVGGEALSGDIPESVFFMFQMTFAIITPALICGAYPERMKFSAVMLFSALWLVLVYAPVAHWVWGGGWAQKLGVMDFAGGIVVHATAGVSALVLAAMLGPRAGFPGDVKPPHSPGMTMAGGAMLWVGWFGFNAGSALAANHTAGAAMAATHISAASAALTWMAIEWMRFGKPSLIGTVTGMVAGLATVTPGSGFIGPVGALIYGVLAGAVCFAAVQWVKKGLKTDDSLDVFGVHGVGGVMGTLLAAVFGAKSFGGAGLAEGMTIGSQLSVQFLAVLAAVVWSAAATFAIAKAVAALTGGLRVSRE
ncbi:MAG: ammonium transporter, partial [Rhodospirillales bacterium]